MLRQQLLVALHEQQLLLLVLRHEQLLLLLVQGQGARGICHHRPSKVAALQEAARWRLRLQLVREEGRGARGLVKANMVKALPMPCGLLLSVSSLSD